MAPRDPKASENIATTDGVDTVTGNGTGDPLPVLDNAASESTAAIPSPAVPVAPPRVHTKDRDPADREAWKRERAKQLGHTRD